MIQEINKHIPSFFKKVYQHHLMKEYDKITVEDVCKAVDEMSLEGKLITYRVEQYIKAAKELNIIAVELQRRLDESNSNPK